MSLGSTSQSPGISGMLANTYQFCRIKQKYIKKCGDQINIPRKLQHTPGAQPRQSHYPTMKGFPLQPVGKGLGVCSKGVLKQPSKYVKK